MTMTDTAPRATASEPRRANWAAVWALSLGVASLSTAEMLPMSLLTPMAADLHISEGMAGQAVSASAIVAVLTSLFIAPIIRSVDRRHVLLALAAAQVVSNLAVALAPSYGPLMLARLVLGFAVGGFWGLSASLALRLVPKGDLARALSIIFGGGAVSGIAAAPLGAFLGVQVGWRGVFFAATALALIVLATQLFTLPKMPPTGATALSGLWHTLKLPQIAAGMLGVVLMFGGRQMFATYLRPFLEQITKLGVNGVSLALLLLGVASFAGTTAASWMLKRDLRTTLVLLATAQAVALGLLLLVGASSIATFAIVALFGFATGAVPVSWSTWLTRSIPDNAESGGGILVAAIQGSMLAGAALGGAVIDGFGVTAQVAAAALILLIGAAHTFGALRPRPV